ncbi:hypothetical protein [Streptomyces sp. NBC_00525]|uniref:hypothetical protein n=1 Tax=Streptomyces sp. NBC_00525 TaxID=2903660 RepID=UPI002E823FF8|nr:hypothetical protein [Streptomyces sp. NBC_00525]WUC92349.1 hypothetical protein OG710_01445 [Streptomyces sp. NBC_00525]
MNNGLKTTAFAAALAATFGIAYGVGGGIGPVGTAAAQPAAGHGRSHGGGAEHAGHGANAVAAAPGGLQVSDGGYTLDLRTPAVEAGDRTALRFAVLDDATGRPLTAYQPEHGKELHLILASHDLTTYRHLHPERGADGVWSVTAALPEAGDYRVFADFTPEAEGARNLTLGADLAVAGHYRPKALPAASTTTTADGYRVTLNGTPVPGRERELTLTVSRDGKPVTDLQPYLGAYGHLVALRAGDLAYLHVHPEEGGPGPSVSFAATAPSAGTYRLFLDFRHGGEVHTAAFTVTTGRQAPQQEAVKPQDPKPETGKSEAAHTH